MWRAGGGGMRGALAGAALVEDVFGAAGQLKSVVAGLFDGHLQRAIEDEAEGAVFAVLDHEDDGAEEVGIGHSAGGEEKFAPQGVHVAKDSGWGGEGQRGGGKV